MGATRVGIFGGTFDPPHIGHLVAAEDAAATLGLDEVWFVPAGAHPLKRGSVTAPADARWAMVQAAVAGNPRFRAIDVELQRAGPSYSVETLQAFRQEFPGTEFYFLVGADVAAEFDKWREPETIARLARLTILSRGGEQPPAVGRRGSLPLTTASVTRVDVSSTEVRRRIRAGEPFRYLVPEGVYRIIVERRLYRSE